MGQKKTGLKTWKKKACRKKKKARGRVLDNPTVESEAKYRT